MEAIPNTITEMLGRTPFVISPWLPTMTVPYAGTFVVDSSRYLSSVYSVAPILIHVDDSFRTTYPRSDVAMARRLMARTVARIGPHLSAHSIHMPIPIQVGDGWRPRVEHALEIGLALGSLPDRIETGVDVHAHVGMIAGAAALGLTGPYRLIVYEHASFVFGALDTDPFVRQIYERVLDRADLLLCVNPVMAQGFTDRFPQHGDKVRVHPNPVDFARFTFAQVRTPPTRWLYIGNLKSAKGTRRLAAAFARAIEEFPDLSLTLVGRGEDAGWLQAQGLGDRLTLLPPVPAAAVPDLMAAHDVLVHLSEGETFGLTAIEAVASGTPVIVTSTAGSEHTLRRVIDNVGRLVPQPGEPDLVVAAYAEIRRHPPDLAGARKDLASWLSPEAVARSLSDLLVDYPPRGPSP